MHKILMSVLVLLVLSPLLWPPKPAFSQSPGASESFVLSPDERAWLQTNASQIQLWYNSSFPPLEFADSKGAFVGLGADVIILVEEKLGIRFNKVISNDWVAHLRALESGECAIAPTIVSNEERKAYAFFTVPYAKVPVVIIGSKDRPGGMDEVMLEKFRVAVVKGYASESYLQQKYPAIKLTAVHDVEEGLQTVAFGQVDFFVEDLAVASYVMGKLGIANLRVVGTTAYHFDFSIGVSKKYPLLYSSIEKALSAIEKERLHEARAKWISLHEDERITAATLRKVLLALALVSVMAIAITLVSVILKRRLDEQIRKIGTVQSEVLRNEERFRALFMQAPLPLVELSRDGRVINYNDSFVEVTGYSLQDAPTISEWWALAYPDAAYRQSVIQIWNETMAAALNKRKYSSAELRIRCRDGHYIDVLGRVNLVLDQIVVSLFDISELKRAEHALRESDERYRIVSEQTGQMLYDWHLDDGDTVLWGGAVTEITAYDASGFADVTIGRWMEMIHPDDRERVKAHREAALESCSVFRDCYRFCRKDGTYCHINEHGVFLPGADAKAVRMLGTLTDISEQKKIEEALRQNEENLRVTLNSIGDAVIATDTQGKVTRMNMIAERLTGWKLKDALGCPLDQVLTVVNAISGEILPSPVLQVMQTGESRSLEAETVLISRKGLRYQIADSGAPIRNDFGDVIGAVLVFRDVTDENRLQEQLRQSQKMDAIGQLAGGVAHDFNNMLCGIIGAAELLNYELDGNDEAKKFVGMIRDSAVRAADLTAQLLTFSRKRVSEQKHVDVHEALSDALSLVERTVDKRISFDRFFYADQLTVMGDHGQLQNAFINILINASHAMPEGGRITVKTGRLALNAGFNETALLQFEPGEYVEIAIYDTGTGIAPEHLPHIFEPFFTTKAPGQGSGLGLAAVFGTIQQHMGTISVTSSQGNGSCFKLYLPLFSAAVITQGEEGKSAITGSGLILLVDDEQVMRITAGMILKNLGYSVLQAEDGMQALEIFREKWRDISLVILDMVMPQMNGRDALRRMREIHPGVRALLSSGGIRDEDTNAMLEEGFRGFIRKPYRSVDLSIAVHEAMG